MIINFVLVIVLFFSPPNSKIYIDVFYIIYHKYWCTERQIWRLDP